MKASIRLSDGVKRWLRWVPNALTLCNSLCGFFAILYMLLTYESPLKYALGTFSVAATMIFCAMLFDAMDGMAARALNAASMHGIQMDSLSDMVTFGVAPAVLVAIMTHCLREWEMNRPQLITVYLLCSVYLGGAALRLATYNVHAMDGRKSPSGTFSGLPSPGAAAAICVVVFFANEARIDLKQLAFILPAYAAVLGLLMVSSIPYIHAGRWLTSVRRNRRRLLFLFLLLALVAIFRTAGLAAIVTGYVLSGPVIWAWNTLFRKKREVPPCAF